MLGFFVVIIHISVIIINLGGRLIFHLCHSPVLTRDEEDIIIVEVLAVILTVYGI